eukprot:366036-Chlamydomonas_euryale.AAC.20
MTRNQAIRLMLAKASIKCRDLFSAKERRSSVQGAFGVRVITCPLPHQGALQAQNVLAIHVELHSCTVEVKCHSRVARRH